MTAEELATTIRASSLAAVCWVDPAGRPRSRGVVALVRADRPALAFTYADAQVARDLAGARDVVLALSETRSTGRSFVPSQVRGRPRLVEDPSGDLFVADLLEEELRRFPPARLYADSPLLRREHWWYLPRLVVELDVAEAKPMPARSPAHDHLLVVADGPRPVVRPAGLPEEGPGREDEALALRVEGSSPPAGPAVLFGQDAGFPDLERWSQWSYRGVWDGSALEVHERPAQVGLGRTPGLWRRWRRHRELERRCVEALSRR